MAQFEIVKNLNTKSDAEFLLELQSDSVYVLNTRIVAPIRKAKNFNDKMISKVHIKITVGGIEYITFISEMAAVPSSMLGECVGNAKQLRTEIVSAVDLLFTGF